MQSWLRPPLATTRQQRWRRVALMLAALLFALGILHTLSVAGICDHIKYRQQSFAELAYSDISCLHADRGCRPHGLPFFEDRVEYPVLLALTMWAPSIVAPSGPAYFLLSCTILAVAFGVTVWAVMRIPGSNPWILLASPAIYAWGVVNWDFLAMAPCALGLQLLTRNDSVPRRDQCWAMAALAAAVWTKFFPVVAVWAVLVVTVKQSGWRRALLLLLPFAIVTLIVNAPFAWGAAENWSYFFRFNRSRPIEPTLYTLFGFDDVADVGLANGISLVLLVLGSLSILWRSSLRPAAQITTTTALLLCIWMFGNKVFSPQYWLWILFGYSIAGGSTLLGLAAGLLAMLEKFAIFSDLSRESRGFLFALQPWFKSIVTDLLRLRYLLIAIVILDLLCRWWLACPNPPAHPKRR